MRNIFGRLLGALLQSRVDRKGHLRHFIDRPRAPPGASWKPSPARNACNSYGVHRIDHAMKQLAQLRVAVQVVAALEHPVHGFVKILARRFQVPGLVVLLAGSKFLFDARHQVRFTRGRRRQQRGTRPRCGIHQRQFLCEICGGLGCCAAAVGAGSGARYGAATGTRAPTGCRAASSHPHARHATSPLQNTLCRIRLATLILGESWRFIPPWYVPRASAVNAFRLPGVIANTTNDGRAKTLYRPIFSSTLRYRAVS